MDRQTYTALVICIPASSSAEELARWKVPNREDRRRLILSHCEGTVSSTEEREGGEWYEGEGGR